MRPPTPRYIVTAELSPPDFEAERTFLRTERRFVARRLEELSREHSLAVDFGNWLGKVPRYKDWEHYDHELGRYERKLDLHQAEIARGLMPVKLIVHNNTARSDHNIHIRVEVVDGLLHKAKKAPKRPTRIDGVEPTHWWRLLSSGGFWRSGVRITGHQIGAKFSRLGGHDAAYVVNDPVYIEVTPNTHLTYTLTSQHCREPQRGEVLVYEA